MSGIWRNDGIQTYRLPSTLTCSETATAEHIHAPMGLPIGHPGAIVDRCRRLRETHLRIRMVALYAVWIRRPLVSLYPFERPETTFTRHDLEGLPPASGGTCRDNGQDPRLALVQA
jgi:hypothetical protein